MFNLNNIFNIKKVLKEKREKFTEQIEDGTSILLSSTEVNTVIIFSVSKIGPLLLGTCELRKKYD